MSCEIISHRAISAKNEQNKLSEIMYRCKNLNFNLETIAEGFLKVLRSPCLILTYNMFLDMYKRMVKIKQYLESYSFCEINKNTKRRLKTRKRPLTGIPCVSDGAQFLRNVLDKYE